MATRHAMGAILGDAAAVETSGRDLTSELAVLELVYNFKLPISVRKSSGWSPHNPGMSNIIGATGSENFGKHSSHTPNLIFI